MHTPAETPCEWFESGVSPSPSGFPPIPQSRPFQSTTVRCLWIMNCCSNFGLPVSRTSFLIRLKPRAISSLSLSPYYWHQMSLHGASTCQGWRHDRLIGWGFLGEARQKSNWLGIYRIYIIYSVVKKPQVDIITIDSLETSQFITPKLNCGLTLIGNLLAINIDTFPNSEVSKTQHYSGWLVFTDLNLYRQQ